MAKEFTKVQNIKVKKLIRKSCANFFDENCCLLDDGYGCPCIQFISCHLMCNYFKNAVLPLEPSLERELLGYTSKEICVLCKKPFIKTGRNQRYCVACSKQRRKTKHNEYQFNYAHKNNAKK